MVPASQHNCSITMLEFGCYISVVLPYFLLYCDLTKKKQKAAFFGAERNNLKYYSGVYSCLAH